jgi:limonene-1,2-epoxide hydrolase
MITVFQEVEQAKEEPRTVVRLLTTSWWDGKGLHIKRSLTVLRRRSMGHCQIEEDVSAVGATETAALIENLDDCKDGVYEVVLCNVRRDWETGYIDSWGYKLLPFTEGETE